MKKRSLFTLLLAVVLMLSSFNFNEITAYAALPEEAACSTHSDRTHWKWNGEIVTEGTYPEYQGTQYDPYGSTCNGVVLSRDFVAGKLPDGNRDAWYYLVFNREKGYYDATICDGHHTHTYKTEWSKDATNHWKDANCEHTSEKSSSAAHTWNSSTGKCTVCEYECLHTDESGATCSKCGKSLHTHTWEYSLVGTDTIKATCNVDGHTTSNNVTITINATSKTYSGSAYTGASIGDTSAWTGVALEVPTIEYVGRDGTSYGPSATAPTDAGKYKATITKESATAEANFEIHGHGNFATNWTAGATGHWHVCGNEGCDVVDESSASSHTADGFAYAIHSYGETGNDRFTCVCGHVDDSKKATAELADAKTAAKAAIDTAVDGDTTANVVSAATTAKSNIDAASTLEDVATAKTNGIAAIATAKGENALAAAKESANSSIDAVVDGDTATNVVDAATAAKSAISSATTVAAVTTAESNGIKAIQNAKAVNDTIEKIDAIGTVAYTSASKEKIDAARAAYDALPDDQKSLITNIDKLTDAEKKYASLKPSESSSKSEEPASQEDRISLEEKMPVSPVTVDKTLVNNADMVVIPGNASNLSSFVTAAGIARGINAAVAASNKAGTPTATIYTGRPMCFNGTIIKAIQNGKKTVVYYFPYKGHIYSVTIPATVQARYVLERSGFAGPFYVGQQLGTTKLVK